MVDWISSVSRTMCTAMVSRTTLFVSFGLFIIGRGQYHTILWSQSLNVFGGLPILYRSGQYRNTMIVFNLCVTWTTHHLQIGQYHNTMIFPFFGVADYSASKWVSVKAHNLSLLYFNIGVKFYMMILECTIIIMSAPSSPSSLTFTNPSMARVAEAKLVVKSSVVHQRLALSYYSTTLLLLIKCTPLSNSSRFNSVPPYTMGVAFSYPHLLCA